MHVRYQIALAGVLFAVVPFVVAADGALDPGFGLAGKAHIVYPNPPGNDRLDFSTDDVAVQTDGKILVVGGLTSPTSAISSWYLARLNSNGSLDTSFAQIGGQPFLPPTPGFMFPLGNYAQTTQAYAVAIRPDGRFVVVGTDVASGSSASNILTKVVVLQFKSDGSLDPGFGSQGRYEILPAATDSVWVSRMQLQSDGSIDVVGTYHQNSGAYNGNQFFFDRINAGGTSDETFRYQFGSGAGQQDQALDLGIDGQGRYVLAGYHLGDNGNYDCAVIRVRSDLYDVDTSFGNNGQTIVAFDNGGDNNDYCDAMAITPGSSIVIGGHGTATVGLGTYQAAIMAMLDSSGNQAYYGCASVCQPYKLAFAYNGSPAAGQSNQITKLLIDNHDPRFPQAIAVGTGTHTGSPGGDEFAIARMNPAGNFHIDTAFNGGNVVPVDFVDCAGQFGNLITHNYAQSAAFVAGNIIAAGWTTPCTFGHDIAVTRLAKFDSIFSYGFEIPYY